MTDWALEKFSIWDKLRKISATACSFQGFYTSVRPAEC